MGNSKVIFTGSLYQGRGTCQKGTSINILGFPLIFQHILERTRKNSLDESKIALSPHKSIYQGGLVKREITTKSRQWSPCQPGGDKISKTNFLKILGFLLLTTLVKQQELTIETVYNI
jgi:hypothetical protein